MDILSRVIFNGRRATGEIKDDDIVECTIIPTGAACKVVVENGAPILHNGVTKFIGDELSTALSEAGIVSDILLNIQDLNYGVSRFLTYNIRYKKLNEWADKLTVYLREKPSDYKGVINVKEMERFKCRVFEVNDKILAYSNVSDAVFGLEVKTTNGDIYFMKPERHYEGTVVALNEESKITSLVVSIKVDGEDKLVMAQRFTKKMRKEIAMYGGHLIGRVVKLKAISYIPGERLEPFWQLTAMYTIDLRGIQYVGKGS